MSVKTIETLDDLRALVNQAAWDQLLASMRNAGVTFKDIAEKADFPVSETDLLALERTRNAQLEAFLADSLGVQARTIWPGHYAEEEVLQMLFRQLRRMIELKKDRVAEAPPCEAPLLH